MRYAIFLLLALQSVTAVFAGPRTKKVRAEYIYHIPVNVSPDAAREIAIQRAQAQAIADEFGSVVTQSSTVRIEASNENVNTDFLSIGGSELKGEWIETIGEPKIEYITDGKDIALRVEISGVIREIESAKVPFDVKILRNGTSDANESEVFLNGDDLYMSFRSPSGGYIAIYLIDAENQAYCLLPYQGQESGFFATKANRRYLFFHPDFAEGIEKDMVDEIITDTSLAKERNRILTVFSPNKFFKATDRQTDKDLPRNLSYAEFQKWLVNLKKHDVDVSIIETAITISNE